MEREDRRADLPLSDQGLWKTKEKITEVSQPSYLENREKDGRTEERSRTSLGKSLETHSSDSVGRETVSGGERGGHGSDGGESLSGDRETTDGDLREGLRG